MRERGNKRQMHKLFQKSVRSEHRQYPIDSYTNKQYSEYLSSGIILILPWKQSLGRLQKPNSKQDKVYACLGIPANLWHASLLGFLISEIRACPSYCQWDNMFTSSQSHKNTWTLQVIIRYWCVNRCRWRRLAVCSSLRNELKWLRFLWNCLQDKLHQLWECLEFLHVYKWEHIFVWWVFINTWQGGELTRSSEVFQSTSLNSASGSSFQGGEQEVEQEVVQCSFSEAVTGIGFPFERL